YIKLNRESNTPLHQQIFESIKDSIMIKRLVPGDKLPTEEELCKYFNISRPVIRQAYNQLIEAELIYRHKGKGSFVLAQKTKYTILQSLNSLSEQISLNDMNPTIEEYMRELVDCPKEYLEKLDFHEPAQVIHIKRMYYGDKIPQFYLEIYLPYDLYFDALDRLKKDEAIKDYSISIPGYNTLKSQRHMTAIKLSPEICESFEIKKGSVGFKIETISSLNSGRIVEYMIAYIKGIGTRMTVNYF
ncbi:MAG: GntR family transcriptional regulator, partial [Ignavibacteria bacterium]|nr:GntR family transcriptional regulator [Ignavibacteria bacterium]